MGRGETVILDLGSGGISTAGKAELQSRAALLYLQTATFCRAAKLQHKPLRSVLDLFVYYYTNIKLLWELACNFWGIFFIKPDAKMCIQRFRVSFSYLRAHTRATSLLTLQYFYRELLM